MSRYTVHHEDKALAAGHDHATGSFVMIWDLTKPCGREPEVDNMLVDEDEMFTGLTHDKMLAVMKEHGFTMDELLAAEGEARRLEGVE